MYAICSSIDKCHQALYNSIQTCINVYNCIQKTKLFRSFIWYEKRSRLIARDWIELVNAITGQHYHCYILHTEQLRKKKHTFYVGWADFIWYILFYIIVSTLTSLGWNYAKRNVRNGYAVGWMSLVWSVEPGCSEHIQHFEGYEYVSSCHSDIVYFPFFVFLYTHYVGWFPVWLLF